MKIVDVNVLLHAVNEDSDDHAAARAWLEDAMAGAERIGLPWIVLLAFLRLVTSARVFPRPMKADDAITMVDTWLARPQVVALTPGEEHWRYLEPLLRRSGTAGSLTTDAHLAAMALEHSADLRSYDSDFARFNDVRWVRPGE